MAGEKSAANTGCPSCASGIAIDPAPHPISSTDSPGFNANSFIKSRAYGAVSSGRKCRALLSHSKESSARRRPACKRIHSPFQSAENSSERASPSTTGQPPSNKKAAPPKRRAATSIYQKEPIQRQTAVSTMWCRSEATATGIEPNRGPVVREPRGGQIYKVDREFRTSRRALNVLSVRVRTVRAGDLIYLPSPGLLASYPWASSSVSSAEPGSVHHGGQARCRRWGSPA